MNGNKLFVDTNIILFLLNGDSTVSNLLDNQTIYISFITELELLGYSGISSKEQIKLKEFISNCIVIDIDDKIKSEVIKLKRKYKLKLPDAIIVATSVYYNIPLISADSDFKKVDELDLYFYQP